MVEKKRVTEQVPNEGVRNAVSDVIKKKPAKPRKKRKLHHLEGAESMIESDIKKACKDGLKTFEILTDAGKLELLSFIEKIASTLKADGLISAFRWNKLKKHKSTGVIVDVGPRSNIPSE